MAILTVIAGLVASLSVAGLGYFVARQTNSGRINTSEAKTLWIESTAMRIELRAEVEALQIANKILVDLNRLLEKRIDILEYRIAELEKI